MSLLYKVITSSGVTGLLSDTTDLSKDTSLKYAIVPSWSHLQWLLSNHVPHKISDASEYQNSPRSHGYRQNKLMVLFFQASPVHQYLHQIKLWQYWFGKEGCALLLG